MTPVALRTKMFNRRSDLTIDDLIIQELNSADIPYMPQGPLIGRLQTNITGFLQSSAGMIELTRAEVYWVACGLIPFDLAVTIFNHPETNKAIRLDGDSGFSSPYENKPSYFTDQGQEIFSNAEKESYESPRGIMHKDLIEILSRFLFADDPSSLGKPYFKCYHIDSLEGLNLFARIVKEELINKKSLK